MDRPAAVALAGFNDYPAAEAERVLLGVCASVRWAQAIAAGRPYASPAALYEAADAALAALDEDEFDTAMAAHPRIGERLDGEHAAGSRREQSTVLASPAETLAALVAGNHQYEARFGHVYLVCAERRSGEALLADLQRRLGNDPASERAIARAELGKINRVRLRRLIGAR